MYTELRYDEKPVRDSGANLQRGIEAVGGRLYLTTQRLIFESHRLNVQAGATVIRLTDIEGVWKCWTRLFGLIPVVPNSLAVATETGKIYRFVISDRDKWMNIIRETRQDAAERDRADDERI